MKTDANITHLKGQFPLHSYLAASEVTRELLYSCVNCGHTTAIWLFYLYCKRDKGKFVSWARHEGIHAEYQHILCGFTHGGSAWNCVVGVMHGTTLACNEVQLSIE